MLTSTVDGAAKRCPQCRRNTLVFTKRYPVLTDATALKRTGTDAHDGVNRLRYESAWICQNSLCGYREVIGEQ